MPEKVIHEIRLNQYSPQYAGGNRLQLGTSHSYGIERLHLILDEGWDGLAVTATFHSPAGLPVRMLMDTDGMVDVPPEATASAGLGKIVISGAADGVQRISCNLPYTVMEHAYTFGGTSTGPTPDVISQILASTLEDRKAAATSSAQAEDAASIAAASARAAAESEAGSKSHANNAASSASAAAAQAQEALAQAKASGEFDGKSAYQYAQEGGYTGTEAEFAAQLAQEMPEALPNPHALTFTGTVSGSYDGSAPVSVEIPSLGSPGGGKSWRLIRTIDIVSGTDYYSFNSDNNGNQFAVKNFMILTPSFPIGSGSYLEIKPNGNYAYTQYPRSVPGNYFCFSMEQISDGYYLIHNTIDGANSRLHSAYLSKQYDSFGTFSSFGFWFSSSVTADTTMYVLGVDA